MAAWTACLCLSTPAEARCGDSGTCNHGRIYLKPVKTTTAKATARTTTVKTTRTTRAIAAKPKKIKQVQRVRTKKPVKTARSNRKPKVAATRTARLRKVSTTRVAMRFPVVKKAPQIEAVSPKPKSTSHAARSGASGGSASSVVAMIKTMAPQYGVPTWFALRIAKIESGYNPAIRGRAGEYGVFQMKCPTARGLGFEGDCSGLADARTNVRWGLEHLSAALKSSGGNLHLAASKHNGGLGRKTIIRKYVNLVF